MSKHVFISCAGSACDSFLDSGVYSRCTEVGKYNIYPLSFLSSCLLIQIMPVYEKLDLADEETLEAVWDACKMAAEPLIDVDLGAECVCGRYEGDCRGKCRLEYIKLSGLKSHDFREKLLCIDGVEFSQDLTHEYLCHVPIRANHIIADALTVNPGEPELTLFGDKELMVLLEQDGKEPVDCTDFFDCIRGYILRADPQEESMREWSD